MDHKQQTNRGIAMGVGILVVWVAALWFVVPSPESAAPTHAFKWLFFYPIPLFMGVLLIVLKRYESEELIRGSSSTNTGIEVERAYLQNTLEQTVIAIPLVISFGAMAPANLLKAIPIHAATFLLGRLLFFLGYMRSPESRIPGFVITNYANALLFFGCLYVFWIT